MSDDKRQVNGVRPGPCPIIDGIPVCPPPIEIDIIKVKKVFQECKDTQVEEVEIFFDAPTNNINNLTAQCVSVEVLEEPCCKIIAPGVVKVSFTLAVTSSLNGQEETVEHFVEKRFRLSRAGEKGLTAQCHIFPSCLFCFVADEVVDEEVEMIKVICCIGVMTLVKLDAEVQLMIPSYGYPPEPPDCERVLGECPEDFEPVWPPYPPQDRDPITGSGGCSSCD